MANMSYCRFQNTSNDLSDCLNVIDERIKWDYYEIERRVVGADARADWERTNV